jgi:Quinohemoprotein amine dehydrogenase, alpha subunit domain III
MKTKAVCLDSICDHDVAERPRYYARQLITADDLTLEQEYFRSKLRTHNRLLHGWGVICGAEVCRTPQAEKKEDYQYWKVLVRPGYALDCCGNEIYIDCCKVVDLRTRGTTGVTGDPCVDVVDPWCSEVFDRCDSGRLYIAVRYKQMAMRPVRVQPVGCGCDDSRCENSRWRDGYEIGVLTECPDPHDEPPDLDDLLKGTTPDCPECSDDTWVGLAEVTVDDDGRITKIDNCSCRRLVRSYGSFWWHCESGSIEVTAVNAPGDIKPGTTNAELAVTGNNFNPNATVNMGRDVVTKDLVVESPTALKFKIDVDPQAVGGTRPLTITNPDCSSFTFPEAITIEASVQAFTLTRAEAPAAKPADKKSVGKTTRRGKGKSKKEDQEV